ncbi:MAG: alpha/beta hydrolase family protein, partial [Parvibaculaceae bacterium]
WSVAFGLPEDQIVNPNDRQLMEKMAGDCIDITGEVLKAVEIAGALTKGFLTADPSETPPWMEVMQRNSPGRAKIGVPVFIAQGMQDTIVRPKVTVDFVKRLCAEGEHVTFKEMEDVDHGKAARKAEGAAVDWMTARLAGQGVENSCGG